MSNRNNVLLKKHLLNNDIPCYMIHNNDKKLPIKIYLVIKVGSINDAIKKRGIAHYLEHMLLVFDQEEKDIDVANIWGCTNFEETIFHVSCLNQTKSINGAMNIIKQIITGEKLNKIKIGKVRKDIISEWYFQVKYDEWKIKQQEKLKEFKDTSVEIQVKNNRFKQRNIIFPYIIKNFNIEEDFPVGKLNDIQNINFNDLKAFHAKYYHEKNLGIIVLGNLNDKKLLNIIEKNIGVIKKLHIDHKVYKNKFFKNVTNNYIFETYNKKNIFSVTIYFFREDNECKMTSSIEEYFLEKLAIWFLGEYLENKLMNDNYEVIDSYMDINWVMKKNKIYLIYMQFKEIKDIDLLKDRITNLLKDFKIKPISQYDKRKIKRMLFKYLDESISSCVINSCINDFIYSQSKESILDYHKLIRHICKKLSANKINNIIKNIIIQCNIYIYLDIQDKNDRKNKIQILN